MKFVKFQTELLIAHKSTSFSLRLGFVDVELRKKKKDGERLFSALNYCHMTRFLELATLQPIAFIYNSIFCIKAYLNSISKCAQKLLPIQSTEKHFIALITESFLQHYNQFKERNVLKIRFRLANCE